MKDWPIFDITLGTFKTNFDNIYTLETGLQTYFCFRQKNPRLFYFTKRAL